MVAVSLFETSLVEKELKDVAEKHADILKQIKEITDIIKGKTEELNRIKEHGLIMTGAKAILESMQKTIQSQNEAGDSVE